MKRNPQSSSREPAPRLKHIAIQSIRDWVPAQDRSEIDIAQAWKIICREYCAALVSRGVCPIDCERCKVEIVDLFRLKGAKKPAALLTWLAKDHSARMIEKLIEAEKAAEQFGAMGTLQDDYDRLFPDRRAGQHTFFDVLRDYDT
jgi:hypothetical protein